MLGDNLFNEITGDVMTYVEKLLTKAIQSIHTQTMSNGLGFKLTCSSEIQVSEDEWDYFMDKTSNTLPIYIRYYGISKGMHDIMCQKRDQTLIIVMQFLKNV